MSNEAHPCACEHCRASGTGRGDDGEWYCDGCRDYAMDGNNEVRCATHGRGAGADTCEACEQVIRWGRIQTGQPGVANWCEGVCGCSGRAWRKEDRGGWTVPTWAGR